MNSPLHTRLSARRPRRIQAAVALAIPAALVLAGCAGGGSSSAGGGGSTASALSGTCGTVPTVAPNDPDKLIPGMTSDIQKAFNGWPDKIQKSSWSKLAKSSGAFKVGYLQQDSGSPVAAALAASIKSHFAEAKSAGEVSDLIVETPGGAGGTVTAADQVRAYQSLVQKGANIIIAQPLSGDALVAAVNSAGQQGIPTITFTGFVDSPYAINITPNAFDGVAEALAKGVGMIGKKGNAVVVQGIEGMSVNTESVQAAEQTLKLCSDIKIVGEPVGSFNDTSAKSAMVSFLASHPEKINLIYQVASMGAGVFAAFDSAGRSDQPVIVDNLPTAASLAWWDSLRAKGYKGLGISGTGTQFGDALWEVMMRTMDGEGPKINQVALQEQFITADNIDKYLVPGATTTSTDEIQTVGSLLPKSYLDGYFTTPGE